MTSIKRLVAPWAGVVLALAALGCSADSIGDNGLEPPSNLRAEALGKDAIEVTWTIANTEDVVNFLVQRRENLQGRFHTVATIKASSGSSYLDANLEAETFYGYRLITVDRLGNQSETSTVAGALTAPSPGIKVITGQVTQPADLNGYHLSISGPFDTTTNIGVSETKLFAPLPSGVYTVALSDVASTCSVAGDSTRSVTVTDQGMATQQRLQFDVSCLDPNRGQVVAIVAVTGDSLDADGYRVSYAGIIPDDTVPAIGGVAIAQAGGNTLFGGLKPGDYELRLEDVEAPCSLTGPASVQVPVAALAIDTVRFAVTCPNKSGGSGPLIWRNTWNPQSANTGQQVVLDVALDLTGVQGQTVSALQSIILFDPAVLTFVSATAPDPNGLGNLTANAATPGRIRWVNFATGTAPGGVVPAARFTFTVTGAQGTSSATGTTIQVATAGDGSTAIDGQFHVVEDTVTVGAGGGGGGNQSPTAHANGPYSGTAGNAISFSSSGSTDPDGTIASYAWTFGDGGTSTAASPTHSYGSAGTFTAALTVTDNLGATGSSQATVTVTGGGGGGNQSPVAAANGPYNGTAGASINFSSAGSSDPDGTIASYSWTFGDGGTSPSQNPSHAYATAGTYTANLTVTDNLGATGSAQATVTVTGGGGGGSPFTWTNAFGAFESVLGTFPLSITLNLSTDIPETTGPEALGSFTVDSIVWDPALLEYHSLAFGSGGGSFNTTNATGGCKCKLLFNGSPTSNTGVVLIATVRLKPVGPTGSVATTVTGLGPILSSPALGSFNYRSKIQVVEGSLTLP